MDFAEHLYTLLAFLTACLFVPGTVVLYTVVSGTRSCLLTVLNRCFPKLDFVRNVTVRTATDTIRNQGIITVLLTVKGKYDVENIKKRLKEHIVEKRDKNGKLMFPHLQTALTQRFGCYAWIIRNSPYFDLDDHVVVGNNMYRGRFVNDLNIQEYVSEIVAKYLPIELPPWQITIIPSYPSERFYLLIRIHHLLLSEEGLGLGDLLLLGPERPIIFRRLLHEDDENPQDISLHSSPLTELFQKPVAIPKLCKNIRNAIEYHWNQFVSAYDPIENPEILKTKAGIRKCSAIVFITSVSILKEVLNLRKQSDLSLLRKMININSIVLSEIEKRQCTPEFVTAGIINSIKPTKIISSSINFLIYLGYSCAVTIPLSFLYELRTIVSKNRNKEFSTETSFSYIYLFFEAMKEISYIWSVIYTAPKMLLDELVISHRDPKHELQTVSLCGRKVVAWSEPLPLDKIRRIANSIGASPSEILISALSGALKEYFRTFGYQVPGSVLTTARFFPLESLLKISKGADSSGPPSGRGLLCLALPISQLHDDPIETIHEVQKVLNEARERQTAIYEASLWQLDGGYITKIFPSLAVRLILNYLSRRYAVALTEVAPEAADESTKQLIWGQEVESAMYWRPPQSNICLSLTLMSYGDSVRLGIMADSMIAPGHSTLVTNFLQQINMLAARAGIPRDGISASTSSSNYQPNIPPDCAMSTNTSVSSASDELRELVNSSSELNISGSADTSRSNSPGSDPGARNTRSSNEENIFPFTD